MTQLSRILISYILSVYQRRQPRYCIPLHCIRNGHRTVVYRAYSTNIL